MKYIIWKFLLINLTIFLLNTTNSFAQSKTRLPNPDRGLRFENAMRIGDYKNPFDLGGPLYNFNTIVDNKEASFGVKDGSIRIMQQYVYLTEYAYDDVLPAQVIVNLQKIFDSYRARGMKLELRFAYRDNDENNPKYMILPSMKRILGHMDQLTSIIRKNIDVIYVLQVGLVGVWGEWHNFGEEPAVNDPAYFKVDLENVIMKILDILPQNRQTQVRLPEYKNYLTGTSYYDRIGFHNDYFTNANDAHSQKDGYMGYDNFTQVKTQAYFVLVDGELPYDGPGSYQINYGLDAINSINQLITHHYSSLSIEHSWVNSFGYWKTILWDKAKFEEKGYPLDPEYFSNVSKRSAYEYITDYLGYRLYMNLDASRISESGNQINLNLKMTNYGFTVVHNPRDAYFVLADENNKVLDVVKVRANLKEWFTSRMQTLTGTLIKPNGLIKYKVGVWFPDYEGSPSEFNPKYAIRVCNSNSNWLELDNGKDKKIGFNQIDLTVVPKDTVVNDYCRPNYGNAFKQSPYVTVNKFNANRTASNDFRASYISSATTTGAHANISYAATTFPNSGYSLFTENITAKIGTYFTLNLKSVLQDKFTRGSIWIDRNNNKIFEDTEKESDFENATTYPWVVVIPTDALLGPTMMRVRLYKANEDPGPCSNQYRSSTIDFPLNIIPDAPNYCSSTGMFFTKDRYLTNLSTTGAMNNISYVNTVGFPVSGYMVYDDQHIWAKRNSTFNLKVVSNSFSRWNRVTIWIDWNGNGVFDTYEAVVYQRGGWQTDNINTVVNFNTNITVPSNAKIGYKKMRVRFWDAWTDDPGACGWSNKDYTCTYDFYLNTPS